MDTQGQNVEKEVRDDSWLNQGQDVWRDSREEEQLYVETVVHRNIVYVYPFLYFLVPKLSLRLFMIKLRAECYVFNLRGKI